MRARVPGEGLAVPMSMPRYTSAESTLMISMGSCSASFTPKSDLPEPVGPINNTAERRVDTSGLPEYSTQRPRKNNRSSSPMDKRTQVGRPWLH